MKQIKFFVLSFISVWIISCQQAVKETHTNEAIIDSLAELQNDPKKLTTDTIISFQDSQSSLDNEIDNSQKITIREGAHNLRVQWISWEELGKGEIKYLRDNIYSIEGEQRNPDNSDYLKIKGTLEPISETELIFDGTVEHQITHLNQGQPCVKK